MTLEARGQGWSGSGEGSPFGLLTAVLLAVTPYVQKRTSKKFPLSLFLVLFCETERMFPSAG